MLADSGRDADVYIPLCGLPAFLIFWICFLISSTSMVEESLSTWDANWFVGEFRARVSVRLHIRSCLMVIFEAGKMIHSTYKEETHF